MPILIRLSGKTLNANPSSSMRLLPLVLATSACGGVDDGTPRSKPLKSEEPVEDAARFVSACASEDAEATGEPPPGLRETGQRVGVALSAARLGDTVYADTAAREFNMVTPENEMKWDAIEPAPGSFRFTAADAIVEFAAEHDMQVRGHTLVWHSQLPDWATELEGAVAVREAMRRHIETTVAHFRDEFPGRVTAWDVVNEALDSNDDEVTYRDSVFYTELGESFVAEAFEMARQADPRALLFYNDYGIESLGAKSQATFEMLRDLVEAGVPIDGIGFQMHTLGIDRGPTRQDFAQNVERYVELGLLVTISEMDVSLCLGFDSPTQALAEQRVRYNQLLGTCLQHPECDSVTLWGVGDSDSWLNSYRPCDNPNFEPWPLAFDDEYQRKPAWSGAFDALTGCYDW